MKYFIAAVLLLVVGAGIWIVRLPEDAVTAENAVPAVGPSFAPQTSDANGVTVTVTPKALSADAAAWDFSVTLDTHTVELTEDIAAASVLLDGSGREYPAAAWNGDAPGGHHRTGVLTFRPISPRPASITLRMLRVGGADAREFAWPLE